MPNWNIIRETPSSKPNHYKSTTATNFVPYWEILVDLACKHALAHKLLYPALSYCFLQPTCSIPATLPNTVGA